MKKRQVWDRGFRRNLFLQAARDTSIARTTRVLCDLIKNVVRSYQVGNISSCAMLTSCRGVVYHWGNCVDDGQHGLQTSQVSILPVITPCRIGPFRAPVPVRSSPDVISNMTSLSNSSSGEWSVKEVVVVRNALFLVNSTYCHIILARLLHTCFGSPEGMSVVQKWSLSFRKLDDSAAHLIRYFSSAPFHLDIYRAVRKLLRLWPNSLTVKVVTWRPRVGFSVVFLSFLPNRNRLF